MPTVRTRFTTAKRIFEHTKGDCLNGSKINGTNQISHYNFVVALFIRTNREKEGESNAKMHLVLTLVVFALIRFTTKNRKFRASKKPTVGFFAQGPRQ